MEPVSLALAAFGTFKEVYLLSKYIAKLARSAKNSEAEYASLEVEFRVEFLFTRSTGLFFLQSDGVVNDAGLNKVFESSVRILAETTLIMLLR